MKAIVQDRYGPPADVLSLQDFELPTVADDEVLVKVRAASVHPDVWHVVIGRPYILRVMGAGVRAPKTKVPGTDIAGVVESVGASVSGLRPGDEVFGDSVRGHQWKNGGAFAEFVSVPDSALALKPAAVSFEQAAAVPTSALIALRSVGEGRVRHDDRVLVNGAGGGVGGFAVQIAKARGAEVTGVDTLAKLELVRSIGADRVIDYEADDFTRTGELYDVIIDIPGNRSFADLKRILGPQGRYVLIGHDRFGALGGRWIGTSLGRFLKLLILRPFGRQARGPRSETDGEPPLVALTHLLESGAITPVVARTFPLHEAAAAIHSLEEGTALGKIVLTV